MNSPHLSLKLQVSMRSYIPHFWAGGTSTDLHWLHLLSITCFLVITLCLDWNRNYKWLSGDARSFGADGAEARILGYWSRSQPCLWIARDSRKESDTSGWTGPWTREQPHLHCAGALELESLETFPSRSWGCPWNCAMKQNTWFLNKRWCCL